MLPRMAQCRGEVSSCKGQGGRKKRREAVKGRVNIHRHDQPLRGRSLIRMGAVAARSHRSGCSQALWCERICVWELRAGGCAGTLHGEPWRARGELGAGAEGGSGWQGDWTRGPQPTKTNECVQVVCGCLRVVVRVLRPKCQKFPVHIDTC